ncbi:hypothetical protein [Flavobacterium restrictum]|uniref:Uncharacterized protein n=1 Tax=Flavobacterium restrictum TaxID=2594428 RepID=A0A553DXT6_9FLAO|nr:hypothetical protein [Flavobacterium restrictum]TRX37577.1 hypothetical protein FNW21_12395 [Flavobacterium restrictum]
MPKKTILNSEEIIHPIFYLLFIGIFNYGLFECIPIDFQYLKMTLFLVTLYLINQFFKISKIVFIKNSEIKKGIYFSPFGFIHLEDTIATNRITEVKLFQDNENYYEIIAVAVGRKPFMICKLANKIPATIELHRIQSIIEKNPILK